MIFCANNTPLCFSERKVVGPSNSLKINSCILDGREVQEGGEGKVWLIRRGLLVEMLV